MAFDAFLKIATIPGEATDDKHKDWIEVLSFSWGVVQPQSGSRSSGGAGTAERADFQDLSIVHALDKASPKLAYAASNGEHIDEVILELCRAAKPKTTYLKYTLKDVLVSSVSAGGSASGGETLPLEECSFNPGEIEWCYTECDHKTGKPGGDVIHKWNMIENKGS